MTEAVRFARWQDHALCRTHDRDLWCSDRTAERALARAICATCPVAEPCLEYARRLEAATAQTGRGGATIGYGIYGGLDEHERHGRTKRNRAGWRKRKAAA